MQQVQALGVGVVLTMLAVICGSALFVSPAVLSRRVTLPRLRPR